MAAFNDDDASAARVGKFMCVVPPKQLRVNNAGQAVRASSNGALDEALSALEFQKSSQTVDGGGVAISVGPAIQAFTDNDVIVSFCGHLTNVDYLAWRLFSPEGRRGDRITQSPLEAASKLIGGRCYEAELICHMYKTFGTKALPKLRGQFSFTCFDARSVRVFAARDPSGTYPLLYGRDAEGTVVVSNFESAKEILSNGDLGLVPAGCFIYGHRGISPQRYAKDEAASQKEAAAAADAAANALRGLKVGRKSVDGGDGRRRSLDVSDSATVESSRRSSGEWSRQNAGNSRLPWRKGREGALAVERTQTHLNAAALPWATIDPGFEKEPDISHEDDSVLDGLETRAELDTVGETRRLLELGTAEEHRQAEEVAVKAVTAVLHRIASGVNMKGMVRMGSHNALQALGVGSTSVESAGDKEMAIHRVPSRSGLNSSMVKVASFGNLGKMQKVGSLSDLRHAGTPGANAALLEDEYPDVEVDDEKLMKGGEKSTSWADMSLLVISGTSLSRNDNTS